MRRKRMDRIMARSPLFPGDDALEGRQSSCQGDHCSVEYIEEDREQTATWENSSESEARGHKYSAMQPCIQHDFEFKAGYRSQGDYERGDGLESQSSSDLQHIPVES